MPNRASLRTELSMLFLLMLFNDIIIRYGILPATKESDELTTMPFSLLFALIARLAFGYIQPTPAPISRRLPPNKQRIMDALRSWSRETDTAQKTIKLETAMSHITENIIQNSSVDNLKQLTEALENVLPRDVPELYKFAVESRNQKFAATAFVAFTLTAFQSSADTAAADSTERHFKSLYNAGRQLDVLAKKTGQPIDYRILLLEKSKSLFTKTQAAPESLTHPDGSKTVAQLAGDNITIIEKQLEDLQATQAASCAPRFFPGTDARSAQTGRSSQSEQSPGAAMLRQNPDLAQAMLKEAGMTPEQIQTMTSELRSRFSSQ